MLVGHHYSDTPLEFESDMDINMRELWPVVAAAQKWGDWKVYFLIILKFNRWLRIDMGDLRLLL